MTPPNAPVLSESHQALLAASAIDPKIAEQRGYRTVTDPRELESVGFAATQLLVPCLLIPIHGVNGSVVLDQIRPDKPRILRDKKSGKEKAVKYETPKGSKLVLDVPPACLAQLKDAAVPLYITEGSRKADAAVSAGLCCIAVLGVWGWRHKNASKKSVPLSDFDHIALKGRRVVIAFDSDVMRKREVEKALRALAEFLHEQGAAVAFAYLKDGPDGTKVGLDDFFAAGGTLEQLHALTTEVQPLKLARHDVQSCEEPEYEYRPEGIYRLKYVRDGVQRAKLTNFLARIVRDVRVDDGETVQTLFEVELAMSGAIYTYVMPPEEFCAMDWPYKLAGSRAALTPGHGVREQARYAIQMRQPPEQTRTTYTHTGWTRGADGWMFVHASGAIGLQGTILGTESQLEEELSSFRLPDPPLQGQLQEAVATVLRLIERLGRPLMWPLLGAIFRAPLGSCAFSLFLVGPTGSFKSELAAVAQSFYAHVDGGKELPVSWSSTANALEALAFSAKDALLVLDDFAPAGSPKECDGWQAKADRVFRSQGNRSGRSRMSADLSLRARRFPRGLLLATGEDLPAMQSLQARLLALDMTPSQVNSDALTWAQEQAREGMFRRVMAGYLQWCAARLDELRVRAKASLKADRLTFSGQFLHARTPDTVIELLTGIECFLEFAEQCGALGTKQREELAADARAVLVDLGRGQDALVGRSAPVDVFLEALRVALASGSAHLADPSGGCPREDLAKATGWRERANQGSGAPVLDRQGDRIGYVDADLARVYLLPQASVKAAKQWANPTMGSTFSDRTIGKLLDVTGHLLEREGLRGVHTTRRLLGGSRTGSWAIPLSTLLGSAPAAPSRQGRRSGEAEEKPAQPCSCGCREFRRGLRSDGGKTPWVCVTCHPSDPDLVAPELTTVSEDGRGSMP